MGRSILVPIGPNGTILDPDIGSTLPTLAGPAFGITDVFIYSHGWWTTAEESMADYATFATGLAMAFRAVPSTMRALEIGLHWPATVSEDSNILANIAQPFSFYSRSLMANAVGKHGVYALIRLILEARHSSGLVQTRFNLIGHSFGCKVVCEALQAIVCDGDLSELTRDLNVNLILLQGALDNDSFEAGQDYSSVLSGFGRLRVLATKSSLDSALNKEYPVAERVSRLFGTVWPALGAAGFSPVTRQRGVINLSVDTGTIPAISNSWSLVEADLSPLHQHDGYPAGSLSGHHSDIFQPEIYSLISSFVQG